MVRLAINPTPPAPPPVHWGVLEDKKRTRLGIHLQVIYGPPGTGKTETLKTLLANEVNNGVHPSKIAFTTFTRAGIRDAKVRISQAISASKDDLVNFSTIHSAAFRLLNSRSDKRIVVMDSAWWKKFCDECGFKLSLAISNLDSAGRYEYPRRTKDDDLRFVVEWSRARLLDLKDGVKKCPVGVSYELAKRFFNKLKTFKNKNGLLDFSDLLERVLAWELKPGVKIAFIDEAQDLSPLQVAVAKMWFEDCQRVVVAGDDDQSVYSWAGAEPDWLISLETTADDVQVLPQSYRVPRAPHALAQRIIAENKNRVVKSYSPSDSEGEVRVADRPRAIELIKNYAEQISAEGDKRVNNDIFILARNHSHLQPWAQDLLELDVPFLHEGRPGVSPLTDATIIPAFNTARSLIEGESVTPGALRGLLNFVPTRGNDLLPHGLKARVDRLAEASETTWITTELLRSDDWGLGEFVNHLVNVGPAGILMKIKSGTRLYLERLVNRYGTTLPEPRIRLMSMHASKGREASVVVVLSDMSKSAHYAYQDTRKGGRELEHRIAYVAVTRTLDKLVIVPPTTRRFFPFEHFLKKVCVRPL